MRKSVLGVVLLIAVQTASAAIRYAFRQTTSSELDGAEVTVHPVIAVIPTDHYHLAIDYDITVTFGTLPLTQSIHTLIDRWTTMAFGEIAETFLSGGALRTGNPDIDDMVALENAKGKGFPLRQTVRITAINNRAGAAKSPL